MEGAAKLDLGRSLVLVFAELSLERYVYILEALGCCSDSLLEAVRI